MPGKVSRRIGVRQEFGRKALSLAEVGGKATILILKPTETELGVETHNGINSITVNTGIRVGVIRHLVVQTRL